MRGFGVSSAAALVAGLFIWGTSTAGCTADGSSELDGDAKGSGGSKSSATNSGGNGGLNGANTSSSTGGVEECFGVEDEATPAYENADIIFAIDTSGSMGDESGFVNDAMNAFSQQIIDSGIDVRVVMLAAPPPPIPVFPGFPMPAGICIAAPLGSGSCPDDHNPPLYHHPSSDIGSSDSLQVVYDLFPSYESVLRDDANTYLIIITDDNYAPQGNITDAQSFVTQWTALAPTKLNNFIAHAIYCFDGNGDCVTKGQVYEDLVNLTAGGIHGNLAQQAFGPIFDAVANQVIVNAGQLPCEYLIPDPPDDEELNPDEVNAVFTDGNGDEHDILRVDDVSACHDVNGGWYYDNPAAPTKIILCPASCDVVSNDDMAKMNIIFGCATKFLPPE